MSEAVSPLSLVSAGLEAAVGAATPHLAAIQSHRSLSSGFFWRPGLIVTADEALAEEGEVTVGLPGGQRAAAQIVGRDASTDIALLQVEGSSGVPATLHPLTPATGALALAVAAHETGIVAGLGIVALTGPSWRSMRGGEIDARIELGLALRRSAEGGLALDVQGRAFGMTVFGPAQRVLVIPTQTIERVASQLEAQGRVPRGYLGLGLQPVRVDGEEGVGAMVMSVDAKGPGAGAGLRQGDVIVAWNEQPVRNIASLVRALGPDSVGRTIQLTVRRGGEPMVVSLAIAERSSP